LKEALQVDTSERIEIAIVEDNEAVSDALATILVLEGYTVRTYACGHEFLNAGASPDCILLDLCMPFGSGQEVLEAVDTKLTPIIVISADEGSLATLAALNDGALDFIKKPFDADAVVDKVRAVLRLHQGSPLKMSQKNVL
jgi:DNA-binding response OmpR family regulator